MSRLRIATRRSALALWQAEHVAAALRLAHPGLTVTLLPLTTQGDRILDQPLAAIGGKGLFLKELEQALLAGEAELAVHSLKDVPMLLESAFALPAVLARADPRDALVSNHHASLTALPTAARVGTSSLRRQCQLRALRPDLRLSDLRGNVNTRLRRLDEGDYDAIVLACAGLDRLDLSARISERLAPEILLPAVAQGAIAIETRADDLDTANLVAALEDHPTRLVIRAERAMNRLLEGSCQVPIAGHAELTGGRLRLRGLVGASDGRSLRADAEGPAEDPEALGQQVAEALLAQGAGSLLGR